MVEMRLGNGELLQIAFETQALRDLIASFKDFDNLRQPVAPKEVNVAYAPREIGVVPLADPTRFALFAIRADGSRSVFDLPFETALQLARHLETLTRRHRPDLMA